jgi:hypothetical protein
MEEVNSCGRNSSPTGTQGSIDLYTQEDKNKICHVRWNCPYIGSNDFEINDKDSRYILENSSWSKGGSLGYIDINVYKRPG